MDEFLGYMVVAIILMVLVFELANRRKQLAFLKMKSQIKAMRLLLLGLTTSIVFFFINIAISIDLINSDWINSNFTVIMTLSGFILYFISSYRLSKMKEMSSGNKIFYSN